MLVLSAAATSMQSTPYCPLHWEPAFGGQPVPGGGFQSLAVWDDGGGPALYAGTSSNVTKWNGSIVSTLGGPNDGANALASFDDGLGARLYKADGTRVSKWDGTNWVLVGDAAFPGSSFPMVYVLAAFDDGSGSALYAAGYFTSMSGVPATSIAKWNGTNWSAVGGGFNVNDGAFCMLSFDDGTGPALYAGGTIGVAGGAPVRSVARWNGTNWAAVGAGPDFNALTLATYDDGSGLALYAGGFCLGIPTCVGISKWDGASWIPVGGGTNDRIRALLRFDDGSGPALYAAGNFTLAGGSPANGLARWNGSQWTELGTGPFFQGQSLASVDLGAGAGLYVTCSSQTPVGEWYLARLGPTTCTPQGSYCLGDGSGTACPCGNHSLSNQQGGCLNSVGLPGALDSAGTPSLSGDTMQLFFSGMPDGTPALYFQGTLQASGGAGVAFGDGLLCVGGSIVRLGVKFSVGGWSQFPDVGDPALSSAGLVTGPGTRDYQAWYRDAAAFCTPANYNLSNGRQWVWLP